MLNILNCDAAREGTAREALHILFGRTAVEHEAEWSDRALSPPAPTLLQRSEMRNMECAIPKSVHGESIERVDILMPRQVSGP